MKHYVNGELVDMTSEQVEEFNQHISKHEEETRIFGYIEKRVNEYPSINNYIDGIVKGDQTQVQAYIDACLAVKAKYPKPE
jgi:hypothetical protein